MPATAARAALAQAPTVILIDNRAEQCDASSRIAEGNLTFSTKHKPLWIRQGISFAAAAATYTGNRPIRGAIRPSTITARAHLGPR